MEEQNNNLFEKSSNIIDKSIKFGKNAFRGLINYISYAVIVVATIFMSLATTGFKHGLTPDVIITMIIMVGINITSMSIFIPQGEDNEKKKSTTYSANLELWGKRVKLIEDKKMLIKFREFCKKRTEDLRQEIRENYIKRTGIDIEFYKKHLKDMELKDLKLLTKPINNQTRLKRITQEELQLFVLTKKDYRNIKRSRGTIKVAPISYAKVLAGAIRGNTNYALQDHAIGYKARSIGLKGITIVIFTITTACTTLVPTGASGFQAFLDIIFRLLGVTISTIMGYYTGIKSVKIANSDNKEKILFIDEFFESEKVDINE